VDTAGLLACRGRCESAARALAAGIRTNTSARWVYIAVWGGFGVIGISIGLRYPDSGYVWFGVVALAGAIGMAYLPRRNRT
jgi:hypothetical protein